MPPDRTKFDRVFNVAICGAEQTGKKTILQSFSTEGDDENNTWTTLKVDDENVLVEAEISKTWEPTMCEKFNAVAVIFATDDLNSFESALEILNELSKSAESLPIVLIENKIDLIERSVLVKDVVEQEVKNRRRRLYRVSALKEFHVMHPFAYVLEKLTRTKNDENHNERKRSTPTESVRLPSREAWTKPVGTNPTKNDKCIII